MFCGGDMRFARLGLLLCIPFLAVQGWTQQTSTLSPTQPAAPKDPQAVNVVNQTLTAAGGLSGVMAITDYIASGSIIVHENQDIQGTVTLSGLGLGEFRQDISVPTGVRSFAIGNGQAAIKTEDGTTRQLNFRYQTPLMTSSVLIPCWQLAAALNDPMFGLSHKGITQIDGISAYDIRIQLMPPGPPDPNGVVAEYFGADFFIDTTTFQVRMTQDVVVRHFIRKIRYSNYKPINGVVVAFSIDEEIDGRPSQTIQLNEITVNNGLQESAFGL
jgi:hypothetical protein